MKYHQLTSAQRYTISVLLKKKMSVKDIADTINVHYSTVYRKLKRNKGKYHYHWGVAQKQCDVRKRPMRKHRKFSLEMQKEIIALLINEQWSPEQIRGRMLHKGKEYVCVETIYSYTRFDRRCGGELYKSCAQDVVHQKKSPCLHGCQGQNNDR